LASAGGDWYFRALFFRKGVGKRGDLEQKEESKIKYHFKGDKKTVWGWATVITSGNRWAQGGHRTILEQKWGGKILERKGVRLYSLTYAAMKRVNGGEAGSKGFLQWGSEG